VIPRDRSSCSFLASSNDPKNNCGVTSVMGLAILLCKEEPTAVVDTMLGARKSKFDGRGVSYVTYVKSSGNPMSAGCDDIDLEPSDCKTLDDDEHVDGSGKTFKESEQSDFSQLS